MMRAPIRAMSPGAHGIPPDRVKRGLARAKGRRKPLTGPVPNAEFAAMFEPLDPAAWSRVLPVGRRGGGGPDRADLRRPVDPQGPIAQRGAHGSHARATLVVLSTTMVTGLVAIAAQPSAWLGWEVVAIAGGFASHQHVRRRRGGATGSTGSLPARRINKQDRDRLCDRGLGHRRRAVGPGRRAGRRPLLDRRRDDRRTRSGRSPAPGACLIGVLDEQRT